MKLHQRLFNAIVALVLTLAPAVFAQVPQLINYQGRIAVGTVNFDGNGQFKFAMVNATGSTTYWSNNGTSIAGSEPTAAVTLPVSKGLYSVLLGDATLANMAIIPNSVFNNGDVHLRVWFSNGINGSQLLSPDQRIAAVGYAIMAGSVPDGSITSAKLAPGAVSTSLPVGTALLSSSPVDPTLQGQGYVRLDSGLPVGGLTMFVYQRQADSILRYEVAGPDGLALTDSQSAPLDFGAVTTVPIHRILTLRNLGNQPLTGISATLDGANSNEFIADLGASSLPPGATTTVTLVFNPYGPNGNRSAAIHITAAGITGTFDLNLIGSASVPSEFVMIPSGAFGMGRTSGDADINAPPVTVNVSTFYMQVSETSKAQWDEIRNWATLNGYTDLHTGVGEVANHAVHSISWLSAVKWCNARSEKDGLTPCYTVAGDVMRVGMTEPSVNWSASGYRLPTEAEWEKAARGGFNGKRFPSGTDTITHTDANYNSSAVYSYDLSLTRSFHPAYNDGTQPYTSPVASFMTNTYGLHDIAGNLWEWCSDWYLESYYIESNGTTDPRGPASGLHRVLRGGSWNSTANDLRCCARLDGYLPSDNRNRFGFRTVRARN